MTYKIKLLILAIFYIFHIFNVYNDRLAILVQLGVLNQGDALLFNDFLTSSLFYFQQIFFTTTLFFMLYLYFLKNPLLSSSTIIRWKHTKLKFFSCLTIKRTGLFTCFITLTHIIVALINGSTFELANIIFNFAWLLGLIISMYLIYLALLFVSNKQILSIVAVFMVNIVISAINLHFSWLPVGTIASEQRSPIVLLVHYSIGLVCLIYVYFKSKGEFLT